jgi:hypothetical protein
MRPASLCSTASPLWIALVTCIVSALARTSVTAARLGGAVQMAAVTGPASSAGVSRA